MRARPATRNTAPRSIPNWRPPISRPATWRSRWTRLNCPRGGSAKVQAYSVRGLVHAQLKENAKAEEDFRRALKIAPKNPEVNNNYGWFLCESVKPRQSIQYFLNALKDPLYETPEVAYANAGVCAHEGRRPRGRAELSAAGAAPVQEAAPVTRYKLAELLLSARQSRGIADLSERSDQGDGAAARGGALACAFASSASSATRRRGQLRVPVARPLSDIEGIPVLPQGEF